METKTENTVAGVATLQPIGTDKYEPDNLIRYRTSLALYKNMVDSGDLDEAGYCHIRTILNKKYGLSSGSIFAESA